jgi:hypothetical protein
MARRIMTPRSRMRLSIMGPRRPTKKMPKRPLEFVLCLDCKRRMLPVGALCYSPECAMRRNMTTT